MVTGFVESLLPQDGNEARVVGHRMDTGWIRSCADFKLEKLVLLPTRGIPLFVKRQFSIVEPRHTFEFDFAKSSFRHAKFQTCTIFAVASRKNSSASAAW